MTSFDLHALDGARPDYAPGQSRSKDFFYWKAPKPALDQGYSFTRKKLPGRFGDGADLERARLCREYTREALRWLQDGDTSVFAKNTWGWLIQRYLTDELSPYRDLKANTRFSYKEHADYWQETIGDDFISQANYPEMKSWQNSMIKNGRPRGFIKKRFQHLRIFVSYGVQLQVPGAAAVKAILGEMRFKGNKPRTAIVSKDQFKAIVAAADAAGEKAFALGYSLQWWLALRPVDVRGQWLKMDRGESPSGITRNGSRWADGLTWDMIDLEQMTITKTPSKTQDSMPDALEFDIAQIAGLKDRLMEMPTRVGPVFLNRQGMPYTEEAWGALFRRFRSEAGVPSTIQLLDTRAGAINDAKRHGASPIELQHQANHASLSTTDRYIRERSNSVNRVIALRSN